MAATRYRPLKIVLGLMCFFTAVGGLLLVLGGKSLLVRMLLDPPELEVSTLFLASVKEMGGFLLMLSLMLFFACRDPERNAAIIIGLSIGLYILAITPLLSLYTLDIRRLYPSSMIWARSLVRLVLAMLLLYLRPRPAH
jgi:hypothetical protein